MNKLQKSAIIVITMAALAACAGPQRAAAPAAQPAAPTEAPKAAAPTDTPKAEPTVAPTEASKAEPTAAPKVEPTVAPTEAPKAEPTAAPKVEPTVAPTEAPKVEPTAVPTEAPKAEAPAAAPASGDVVEVNVKMSEFEFALDKTSFPAGKTIRFNIENVGEREHEMVVELTDSISVPLEANGKKAEALEIAPGQKATLEWVFDKPGKFLLGCHVGKHFERGMKLEIDVTG